MKIKVIGIGGIGCSLLPVLARFLNFSYSNIELTLIDGDDYEEKNRDRQPFSRLGNKAEVTVEKLGEEFSQIFFRTEPKYVTEDNVFLLISEGDIIFLCVDNHATRKIVSDRCEELSDVVLISGGNELTDGNIQVYIREGGEDITLPLANSFHPEIQFPEDENPEDLGCEQLRESEPQLLITNNAIAALMLNAFFSHLRGELKFDELYIDIITGRARPVCRSHQESALS